MFNDLKNVLAHLIRFVLWGKMSKIWCQQPQHKSHRTTSRTLEQEQRSWFLVQVDKAIPIHFANFVHFYYTKQKLSCFSLLSGFANLQLVAQALVKSLVIEKKSDAILCNTNPNSLFLCLLLAWREYNNLFTI